MGLAFSLSAAEKNHHQKEYYSGTDVQCVSAFERPHCIMNDRLYSLGWRVILAVISYSSGLHDQAMGIDTIGGCRSSENRPSFLSFTPYSNLVHLYD